MSLAHSILGFLTYDSSTGYDLAKIFDSSVKFFWHAQTSQIYLELSKLEKAGLVVSEQIVQTDKPNKKVYRITEEGKNNFLGWLCGDVNEFEKGTKDPFLVKLFFSGCRSPEDSIKMLKKFKSDCENYFADMSNVPESIQKYGQLVEPYQTLYWNFTADFGNSYMQLCIDWAKRCIKKLEELV